MVKVFAGKDSGYTYHRVLKELEEIRKRNSQEYAQIERMDGYKTPVSFIVESCQTISLFCEKKTVVVSNAYFFMDSKTRKGSIKESEQDYKALEDYLLNPSSLCDTYFVVPGEISTVGSPNKVLTSPSITRISCDPPKDDDYVMLAYKVAKEEHKDIDRDAAQLLLDRTKGDYLAFMNNMNKLFTYTDHVMKNDVEELVYRPLEDRIYLIASNLIKGNVKETIQVYEDLKKSGAQAGKLIPSLATQFNKFALIKYLNRKGYSENEIASELKMRSSGQVHYTLQDCKNLTFSDLVNILADLSDVERDIRAELDDEDTRLLMFFLMFKRKYLMRGRYYR